MTARTAAAGLFCAFIGAWIARAIFVWILDVPRTWEIVAVAAGAAIGVLVCVAGALEEQREQRRGG